MKKEIFLSLVLFFTTISYSQSALPKNISDSLWGAWTNSQNSDSLRLAALSQYTRKGYVLSQPDSGYYFAQLMHDFAVQVNMPYFVSEALNNQGICMTILGEYDHAVELYLQCIEIDIKHNDERGVATSLGNIGLVYKNKGDLASAHEYYTQALNIHERLNSKRGATTVLANIGGLYLLKGNYELALEYYYRSLALKKELNDYEAMPGSYLNIAIVSQNNGNYSLAHSNYNKSLEQFQLTGNKFGISSVFYNMGSMYRENNNLDSAIYFYTKSLEIRIESKDKAGISFCLRSIAWCQYLQGHYGSALERSHQAMDLALELGSGSAIKESAKNLGLAYMQLNQNDSALHYLSLTRRLMDKEIELNYFTLPQGEKETYFASNLGFYNVYYDFAVEYSEQYPAISDTIYNMALLNKSLSLKSTTAMRNAVLNSQDSLLISEYKDWIELRRQISVTYSKGGDIRKLQLKADELEQRLIKRSDLFSDFGKIKNLTWDQVKGSLKPGECAVEFINYISEIDTSNPTIYAALLVQHNSNHPTVVKLCSEEDLIDILGDIQGNNLSFIEKVYGKKSEAKTELYEKIWEPLEPYLKGVETVYYSPAGLLHKVSFASICKAQDVFLSDVYNFRQMGSTGNIAFENKTGFGELENFLLMGGVHYNSDTTEKNIWNYLPGSLTETESINSYLLKKKFGVNYFKEANASEEVFKEKIVSSSIVHIATHGFFFPDPEQVRKELKANSESNQELKFRGTTNYADWSFVNNKNPLMRSGIVLANANDVWSRSPLSEGEDGILTAQEVSNLDLRNTKLVVLSACETGLGDIKGSEGVFGLQRAFKMAGVKYLIMSLWQVPDKETSEFMILFYKNLIKLKDIPTAFQKTQKVMREKYDPYYWGAFVLIE